jgi:hypothetical protein
LFTAPLGRLRQPRILNELGEFFDADAVQIARSHQNGAVSVEVVVVKNGAYGRGVRTNTNDLPPT